MNKHEIVDAIAAQTGLTKKQAAQALEATLGSITQTLAKGDKVVITGFGTFEVRQRKARVGTKPGSSEKINIPAKAVAGFKAGKELRAAIPQ